MGKKLNKKVWHLDQLLWKPNWTPTTEEEQKVIQLEVVKEADWIIDGNYLSTMEIRLQEADTIIFLHFSKVICTFRAIKRVLKYWNRTRPDMREGCNEKFDLHFFKWVWNFPKVNAPQIVDMLSDYGDEKQIIILRSPKEAQQFLDQV